MYAPYWTTQYLGVECLINNIIVDIKLKLCFLDYHIKITISKVNKIPSHHKIQVKSLPYMKNLTTSPVQIYDYNRTAQAHVCVSTSNLKVVTFACIYMWIHSS